MQTELEAKWLDIDLGILRAKLKSLGAKLVHPERLMRRKNFDFEAKPLEKIGGWVRVRDQGDKITMSYKQLNDRSLHGTKEVTVVVDDFQKTCEFLEDIGLKEFAVQETKREAWEVDGVEVAIDTWPWIPTFVEVEGMSEHDVRSVAERLGLEWSKALHGSVEIAYQAYYGVTDQELYNCPAIVFGPVPDWLERRRR